MTITRQFAGWDGPLLPRAAATLRDELGRGEGGWDMGQVIAVLPAQRAGRRLLELLAEQAQAEQAVLIPPRIETTGRLPEMLYEPSGVQAGDLDQQLAWIAAMRSIQPDVIADLLPHPPAEDDLPGWWAYATQFRSLRDDLAGHRMHFVDVPRLCLRDGVDLRGEGRWTVLDEIEQAYLRVLAEQSLTDRALDRLDALHSKKCATDSGSHVVLIACPDLNDTAAAMLRQAGQRITALVMAPESHAEGFDDLGILKPDYWLKQPVELQDDQLRFVGRKTDQAEAVVRAISDAQAERSATDTPLSADHVTVGLGDERFAGVVRRRLDLAQVPCRSAAGTPAGQSRPARLLRALGRYLEEHRLDALAELLRHPDLEAYLHQDDDHASSTIGNWLTLLDRYATDHLQGRLTDYWLGRPEQQRRLKSLRDKVDALLPIQSKQRLPLSHLSEPIAAVLAKVYHDVPLREYEPEEHRLALALDQIADVLREQSDLNDTSSTCPQVTASQAIALTLRRLSDKVLPDEHDGPAVELLGYLELALDDAPVLAITGMNEGSIPSSRNADAFLPDTVRKQLSMHDNDHRYARDLMLLNAITHSRPTVRLIAARRTDEGDPLKPSRLLMTCDDDTLVRRVTDFFSESQDGDSPALPLPHGQTNRFLIPRPVVSPQPLSALPVTAFRAYLACPYRFYLRYVLKLAALDDSAVEMDPLAFGSITHEVLQAFGQSDLRDETNDQHIKRFLHDQLDETIASHYGEDRRPAIRIQAEQLRERLDTFANRQASLAQAGWRIVHVEQDRSAEVHVDDQPFTLKGKIDRIDHHDELGWRIYDYKTGEAGDPPEKTHHTGKGDTRVWKDLQLPLYRDLCAGLGIEGDVALGYFNLPKKLNKVGPSLAKWDASDLDQANEERDKVIRAVRAQRFWPPAEYKGFPDGYERVCGDSAMQRSELIRASHEQGGER